MTWMTEVGARLWHWKRYWLAPVLVFVLLWIVLVMLGAPEPQGSFKYATF